MGPSRLIKIEMPTVVPGPRVLDPTNLSLKEQLPRILHDVVIVIAKLYIGNEADAS